MNIQEFSYNSKDIRVILVNGSPLWVARDVCAVLEIRTDTVNAILDDDEYSNTNALGIRIDGVNRGLTLITETGLYSLVFKSRKPEARKFKRWITHDVIPSIRKTGGYNMNPQQLIATALVEAHRIIEEYKPAVEAFNTFLSADNCQPIGEVAKMVGIGRNTLFKVLRDKSILMQNNVPYQEYMRYFKVIDKPVRIGNSIENKPVTLVNPSGIDYIRRQVQKA